MEELCLQQTATNHLLSLPRLLNNRMLELRQQFLSRPKKREQAVNLRQNLFGCPANKKENLDFAQAELEKTYQTDCQRWNFNIDSGEPMEEGKYHWELVKETAQALDTSGRLTCLTTAFAASNNSSCNFSATSSKAFPSPSSSSSSSSPASSPTKRAVTTTIFSTTTTPTAVISKKCLKRLQKSGPNNKVPKLITDYFKESKAGAIKYQSKEYQSKDTPEEKETVSSRLVEILKIRSMNVR